MTEGEGGEHDACLSSSVILGASPGIQAIIVLPVRVFLPSVILGPCSGVQFFIANTSLDSRLRRE